MTSIQLTQVVLDTNVVFEGMTKRQSSCGLIIDAWVAGAILVCVTDAIVYEYVAVLTRKLSPVRWHKLQEVLSELLDQSKFVTCYYSWRPISPDPNDDFVIDCAMNANATLVTSNMRDFRRAQHELGLRVMTPDEFVNDFIL